MTRHTPLGSHATTPPAEQETIPFDLVGPVLQYQARARSAATQLAYARAWAQFVRWCQQQGLQALPAAPLSVAAFLASEAQRGLAMSTLTSRAAAIAFYHQQQGQPSPLEHDGVRSTLAGIRRSLAGTPQRVMRPIVAGELQAMLALCDDSLTGLRDGALLAVGFAGAFRRAELVALRVQDLAPRGDHLVATVPRSKTDQTGKGGEKPLLNGGQLMAVHRLQAWLQAAGLEHGPVFRQINQWGQIGAKALSAQSVRDIVRKYAGAAQLTGQLGAHSLRSGFITTAAEHRVPAQRIMEVTLQTDPRTVLRYTRRADQFVDHAGEDFL